MVQIKELEHFVKTTDFSDEPLRLDVCTLIENRRNFAESHLRILKANSGKKVMMGYYIRLVKFYKLLKTQ